MNKYMIGQIKLGSFYYMVRCMAKWDITLLFDDDDDDDDDDDYSLSQCLTFKLFGIPYLVGKIKFKLLFHGTLAEYDDDDDDGDDELRILES